MDNQEQVRKEALEETLSRAQQWQELIRTKGWELVKVYYQAKVQHFASALLIEDKPIAEFEGERRELMGLRKLLGHIDNDLKVQEEEIEKEKNAKKAGAATKE